MWSVVLSIWIMAVAIGANRIKQKRAEEGRVTWTSKDSIILFILVLLIPNLIVVGRIFLILKK